MDKLGSVAKAIVYVFGGLAVLGLIVILIPVISGVLGLAVGLIEILFPIIVIAIAIVALYQYFEEKRRRNL